MSQYNFGDLSSPLSGTALINTHLEPWRDALHSLHSGSSRPSYAVAGMMWMDNTTNPWVLKVFDGSDDITLGTLNTTTNVFIGAGISAFGATLIDDADAMAARSTLGLGTIATENTAPANKGGTGQSSYTVGDLLYASGTTALSKLAAGTNGHILTLVGGVPAWTAPSGSGLVYLGSQTASNSATLDFASLITSMYDTYVFELQDILPATDGADFLIRTSTNNGSSYDSGASDYTYAFGGVQAGSGTYQTQRSAGATAIVPVNNVGGASGETLSGTVKIFHPLGAAARRQVQGFFNYFESATGEIRCYTGMGARLANADVDAIRFLFSAGNITSGVIRMYGVVKS